MPCRKLYVVLQNRPSDTNAQLPRAFWALWVCQLVNRLGGFVQPFLVLYLTNDRHVSASTAGAVVAAVGAGTVTAQFAGGWMTDHLGRRQTMLTGFLGTAVVLVALGQATSMTLIWVLAFGTGLMSDLFRPAVSATVADLLGPRERVRGYGLLFWAINLGFSISTVSAGVLSKVGYGLLFWLNAASSVIAALIIYRMVPETRPQEAVTSRRALLPVAGRDPTLLLVIAINIAYAAIYFQGYSTLPLVMDDDGLHGWTYGLVIALNGIVIVLVQPFAVRLLGERDRSVVLAASMLTVGLGFGLGAVVHEWWGYAGSVVVWTFGEIGFATVFGAVIADLAPIDLRGGYMGLTGTAWGFGSILGPLIGTSLLDSAGRTTVWAACAVLGVVLFAAQFAMAPALRRRAVVAEAVAPAT